MSEESAETYTDSERTDPKRTEPERVSAECETVNCTVDGREDGVTTVTIDRPDVRNALDTQARDELKRILAAIDGSETKVVVITGSEDGGAFVAGADINEFRDKSVVDRRKTSKRPRVYDAVADLDQPVIARINGHALGGGCELAMSCDIRVSRDDAKLGQPEINLGLIPGGGGTQRLPRLIGEGQAMRLILTGELVDATEAAELGLVDIVCEPANLDETVDELAASIATNSSVAVRHAKQAIKAASDLPLDRGIDYESELFAQLFATHDANEGVEAFLEGREPEWADE